MKCGIIHIVGDTYTQEQVETYLFNYWDISDIHSTSVVTLGNSSDSAFIKDRIRKADIDLAIDSLSPGLWKSQSVGCSPRSIEYNLNQFSPMQRAILASYLLRLPITGEMMVLRHKGLLKMVEYLNRGDEK